MSYANTGTTSAPQLEIVEENNYYPFGLEHKGYNNLVSSNANSVASNWRYNSKEITEDLNLDMYDYGARNYDPVIGRWWHVDPLADDPEQVDKSPYAFSWNNPIRYVDPTGLKPLDDYGLDKDGNINLLRITDDANDKLIALDANGNETNTSIEVDKGILNNKYSQTGKDSGGNTFSYDILKVRGDEKATNLFEFVADNTNVEWSQTQLGEAGENGLNYLTTSHDKATERGVTQMINTQFHDGYTIRGHIHNHPALRSVLCSAKVSDFAAHCTSRTGQNVMLLSEGLPKRCFIRLNHIL